MKELIPDQTIDNMLSNGGLIAIDIVRDRDTGEEYLKISIEHESLKDGAVWILLDKKQSIHHQNELIRLLNMM